MWTALRQLPVVQIVAAGQELLLEGWRLYEQRSDKDWGLTDCISFVVMAHAQINEAFTSDQHFEQAGFVRLMSQSQRQ